jgi:hypothetical protein
MLATERARRDFIAPPIAGQCVAAACTIDMAAALSVVIANRRGA